MTNRAPTDTELREFIDAMNAPDPDGDSQRREWDDTWDADKPDLETVLDDKGLDMDDFPVLVDKVRARRRAKIEQILEDGLTIAPRIGLDPQDLTVSVELANDPMWGWVFRETNTHLHPAEYRIRKYV